MNLKNKKIIITGATGGIGYSLVKRFYESGSQVLASGTKEEKLENLKKNFKDIHTVKFKSITFFHSSKLILIVKLSLVIPALFIKQ